MIAFVLLISTFFLYHQPDSLLQSSSNSDSEKIIAVIKTQQAAWNRGDVRVFMEGYKNSDSIQFVSSKGVNAGYAKILDRYLKTYPTKEKMGELNFGELEVKLLGVRSAFVIGSWNLKRAAEDGGNVGGYFTLLFEKTESGWKIIVDHTS